MSTTQKSITAAKKCPWCNKDHSRKGTHCSVACERNEAALHSANKILSGSPVGAKKPAPKAPAKPAIPKRGSALRQIRSLLGKLTFEELIELHNDTRAAHKAKVLASRSKAKATFKPGDTVRASGLKGGRDFTGKLIEVRRTRAVLEVTWPGERPARYVVPLSTLSAA